MARRSLQASEDGIQAIKKALKRNKWSQTLLAGRLNCSRQTVWSLLYGNSVDCDLFMQACSELGLDWEAVVEPEIPEPEQPEADDLTALVQSVRDQIRDQIRQQCGTMRVLDMTQPIQLGNIYTNVNILERLTKLRGLETSELMREAGLATFDRFLLGKVRQERMLGLDAVAKFSKLMILGKPGAGKTTFLKHLAIECIDGSFRADRVPVFITLKTFAEADDKPSLLTYLNQLIPEAQPILNAGKALILLDGLDEVKEVDGNRVLQQIRDFSQKFSDNQFVITCRIAAHEYTFEQFTEIEIADFDKTQIADFVNKWFACRDDAVKAERFLEKLGENKPIQELASSPLLLTLLCLVFEDSADFPINRAELYQTGIDVMLKKWDAKRNIERAQIYKKLSLKRKEGLLSHVAYLTFTAGNYFFKQRDVERYISQYIENLPGVSSDPEALELDSANVLKSIEAQHGLFVERARNIYSFSHLTFHEYFTARQISESCNAYAKDDPTLQTLAKQITEPHWREVFLLTTAMLPTADHLLLLMKQETDRLLSVDQRLQEFLSWVQQKSSSVDAPYKPAAVRAFYLARVHVLDLAFFDLALARDLDLAFAFDLALARNLAHILDRTLALAIVLNRALALAPKLKRRLEELKAQIPDASWEKREDFEQWWRVNSKTWTDQLCSLMIEYFNIGHDWQFSRKQKRLLHQYHNANKLLVDCLNLPDIYVSRNVREEIEETLLLPMQPPKSPNTGGL